MKIIKIYEGLKSYLLLLILCSIIISYLSIQVAVFISYAIDGVLFQQFERLPHYLKYWIDSNLGKGIIVISIMILLINVLLALLKYIRGKITAKFTLKVGSNLKLKLYKHVLNLEYKSYVSYNKAEMIQRINEDARCLCKFF